MEDKRISELNNASLPLAGTEEVPIVQNGETKKVNASEFIVDTSEFVKESELSDVATSGDYDDLINKPTIPNANDFVEKSGDTMTGLLQTPVVQEKSRIVVTSNSFPDLALGWEENTNIDLTLNTNCTISQYGLPSEGYAQTITIYVKGDYALTLPTEWIVIGGTYDPNGTQFIVQSWDDGNFYCAIGGGEIDLSNYLQKSGGNINGNLNVSGNVGIGTTNPLTKLHTEVSASNTSGTYAGLFWNKSSNNASQFGVAIRTEQGGGSPLRVSSDGGTTDCFSILSNGDVVLSNIQVFADNTSASSLATGTIYRTSDGTLKIKF